MAIISRKLYSQILNMIAHFFPLDYTLSCFLNPMILLDSWSLKFILGTYCQFFNYVINTKSLKNYLCYTRIFLLQLDRVLHRFLCISFGERCPHQSKTRICNYWPTLKPDAKAGLYSLHRWSFVATWLGDVGLCRIKKIKLVAKNCIFYDFDEYIIAM